MRLIPILIAVTLVLGLSGPAARAASIVYVDNGEVWLSSLDGAQKVRLAAPVVNGSGATEKWLDVAASDGGRIVAVRNEPGKISRLSWFKVWEPDGTSTVEGPLSAPSGWTVYVYPLGFDITADGQHMVYGYSNTSSCCPIDFAEGTYVRPVTNNVLDPINLAGVEDPTIVGSRVIAHSGATVRVQGAATTYGTNFTSWLDTSGTGLELRRTDIAATGQLAALELEQWNGGTQTVGKIAVVSVQGVDQQPAFPAAVDCYLPASGVATGASLSQDARRVAWTDAGGLKVAGAPTTVADPCALSSPPVVISTTGSHASIGGTNVAAFLPPAPNASAAPAPSLPSTPAGSGTVPATGGGAAGAAPVSTLPARVTIKALGSAAGLGVKVRVAAAGKVTITATVPAARLGRKGKPVVIARGSATARGAGTVTVRLRPTTAARKRLKRLKGARVTLRISHGARTTTKSVTLR
jgi:hypothetical protein